MRAHAIQHLAFEDLGGFAPALEEHGISIQDYNAAMALPTDIPAGDLLVVLGGPIGAYQDNEYPFLRQEVDLIERHIRADGCIMGICLGAQLIARALGAAVYPSGFKEIGFAPITLTELGQSSCLAPFSQDPTTLHWHGDTFDLPTGAELLASSSQCGNQAFAIGANIIGFQFHPEATGDSIEHWLIGHAAELSSANLDPRVIRSDAARHAETLRLKAHAVMDGWLSGLGVRK